MILTVDQIKNLSKNWYEFSQYKIPEIGTKKFLEFACKSQFFFSKVSRTKHNYLITIDENCSTAYVDFDEKKIALSPSVFTSKFYNQICGDDSIGIEKYLAISLINGLVCHEALHVAHTRKSGRDPEGNIIDTIKDSVGDNRYREYVKRFGRKLMANCFNIIEDIYIESQLDPKFEKWLECTNDIYFDGEFDQSERNLRTVLNGCINWKNKKNRNETTENFIGQNYVEILYEVGYQYLSLPQRIDISLVFCGLIYDEFLDDEKKDDEDSDESSEGESPKEVGAGSDGETEGESEDEYDEDKDPEARNSALSNETDIGDEDSAEDFMEVMADEYGLKEDELPVIVEKFSKELAKTISETKEFKSDFGEARWLDPKIIDVMSQEFKDSKCSTMECTPESNLDFDFIRNIRAMTTVNRVPGVARTSGSKLVGQRLSRIATDQKIFAKTDFTTNRKEKPEIIINVDMSGSTYGHIINNEMGVAMDMSKALLNSNIPHSVYGHTADFDGDPKAYRPYVFHIFSHNMHVTNYDWAKRFEMARYVELRQNIDGVVINALSKKFTERKSKKFLINLSDGRPASPNYKHEAGIGHTMEMIKEARNIGVNVFSISVIESVVEANDKIYGSKFNIDGSANVQAQFKKLIQKII